MNTDQIDLGLDGVAYYRTDTHEIHAHPDPLVIYAGPSHKTTSLRSGHGVGYPLHEDDAKWQRELMEEELTAEEVALIDEMLRRVVS